MCFLGIVQQGSHLGEKSIEDCVPRSVVKQAEPFDDFSILAATLVEPTKKEKVTPCAGQILAERQNGGVDIGLLVGVHGRL